MRPLSVKRKRKNRAVSCITLIYIVCYSTFIGWKLYFADKVELDRKSLSVYVASGSSIEELADMLVVSGVIQNADKFLLHASINRFTRVKGGRYIVERNMTYRNLVRMFAIGRQTPVNLVISGNIRTKEKLAGLVSEQLEADSISILNLLNDPIFLDEFDLNPFNSILLFMPNTYNVYWNREPKQLFRDMKREFDRYWTAERQRKLDSLKLNRIEAMIVASISIEESAKYDELPRIAGVYINRLHTGMPLQADPTVKYAVGDFSLKRVLTVHTEIDSPYNTYRNTGLPPGPICIPPPRAVDAVLDCEHHDYLFFCAKDDFSGYHVFAKTLNQHSQNANAYRLALNKRKIY